MVNDMVHDMVYIYIWLMMLWLVVTGGHFSDPKKYWEVLIIPIDEIIFFRGGGLTTNQISTISDSAFTTGILPFVCKGPSKCSASCLPSLALIWRFARMAVGADTTALVFS